MGTTQNYATLADYLKEHRTTAALVIAAVSATATILIAWNVPQGLYSDPAWQLRAVQQFMDGISPTINHVTAPNPSDLSTDSMSWINWWPPSTQLLIFPLTLAGLTIGGAVRILSITCYLAGVFGWILWFGRFSLPNRSYMVLALLFPFVRHATNSLFMYSAGILVFGLVPWTLLLADHVINRRTLHHTKAPAWLAFFFLGVMGGLLYVVKYSAVFVSLGILLYLFLLVLPGRSTKERCVSPIGTQKITRFPFIVPPTNRHTWIHLLTAVLGFAVPIVALTAANAAHQSPANLLTASSQINFDPRLILYTIANPGLALADLGAPFSYLFFGPQTQLTANPTWLAVVGLPFGVWVFVKLFIQRPATPTESFALTIFLAGIGCLALVWILTASVSFEYRHAFLTTTAVIPIFLARSTSVPAAGKFSISRMVNWSFLSVFAGALVYGAITVPIKSNRISEGYRTGTSNLFNPLLATHDVAQVIRSVDALTDDNTIFYVTDPITALDVRGRSIIVHADFTAPEDLAKHAFSFSDPFNVIALLPHNFDHNGKTAIIQRSFPATLTWSRYAIEGAVVNAWKGQVLPATSPPPAHTEPQANSQDIQQAEDEPSASSARR